MAEPTPDPIMRCTMCGMEWASIEEVIADPAIELVGYQARFDVPTDGLLLVNHVTPACGTTVGLRVAALKPLYAGPEHDHRATLTDDCSRQCLFENRLEVCEADCDMAWAREVMQALRRPLPDGQERARLGPAIPSSPVRLQKVEPWPGWFSYLGAVGGCLDHLGVKLSRGWLYGGTGLAFMLNMRADVDVAGPIAWDGFCTDPCRGGPGGMAAALAPNLGYEVQTVCSCPFGAQTDGEAARGKAWELACESLAQARPCIAFELADPEFGIVCGNTRDSYFYVVAGPGPDAPVAKGAVPWDGIGGMIGWVHLETLAPCEPASDQVAVCEALAMVHARMNEPPGESEFVLGLRGYDLWAEALERGEAEDFGHRYNAAAWAEARQYGVEFLHEAARRLGGEVAELLGEAAGHYQRSAEALAAVHALHPMEEGPGGKLVSPEAAALIREAGAAEALGLPLLGRIARELAQ